MNSTRVVFERRPDGSLASVQGLPGHERGCACLACRRVRSYFTLQLLSPLLDSSDPDVYIDHGKRKLDSHTGFFVKTMFYRHRCP